MSNAVQLPAFWHESPRAWWTFCQSRFYYADITDEQAKFHHILINLPGEVFAKLPEGTFAKYQEGHYDRLQTALCDFSGTLTRTNDIELQTIQLLEPKLKDSETQNLPNETSDLENTSQIPNGNSIPQIEPFSLWTVCLTIFSLSTYLLDIGTDLNMTIVYFWNGHSWHGSLTMLFILSPGIVMALLGIAIAFYDSKIQNGLWQNTKFILQLVGREILDSFTGPVKHYLLTLKWGFKQRANKGSAQECSKQVILSTFNASHYRLYEALFESAPQLTLQLCIVLVKEIPFGGFADYSQFATMITLFLSLSWTIISYSRISYLFIKDGQKVTWLFTIMHYLWILPTISARIIALALFAICLKNLIALVIIIHWFAMCGFHSWLGMATRKVWNAEAIFNVLYCSTTNLFHPYGWEEYLGSGALSAVVYYSISLAVNLFLMGFWYETSKFSQWARFFGLYLVFGLFFIGIVFLLLTRLRNNKERPLINRINQLLNEKQQAENELKQFAESNVLQSAGVTEQQLIERKIEIENEIQKLKEKLKNLNPK